LPLLHRRLSPSVGQQCLCPAWRGLAGTPTPVGAFQSPHALNKSVNVLSLSVLLSIGRPPLLITRMQPKPIVQAQPSQPPPLPRRTTPLSPRRSRLWSLHRLP